MVKDITIKTDQNWRELLGAIRGANESTKQHISDALYAAGLAVVHKARPKAPYKTGNLRRSITTAADISKTQQYVGTNEPYAAVHEYGGPVVKTMAWGRTVEPFVQNYKEHAYLRRGLEESDEKITKIFDRAITDLMGDLPLSRA